MDRTSIEPVKRAKEYIANLKSQIRVDRAILFGSCARENRIKEHGDIDIIVLSSDFKDMDFMKRLVLLSQARGRKFMSPAMDILGYTPEEFEKLSKESIVLAEAKKEGIIL